MSTHCEDAINIAQRVSRLLAIDPVAAVMVFEWEMENGSMDMKKAIISAMYLCTSVPLCICNGNGCQLGMVRNLK